MVSEGLGADWLREHGDGVQTLVQLPFQPYENLADVIGTADIVVAILEPDAGAFSVPSKVLTYLAAARPIVAAVPRENLAARLIIESGAGMVVPPGDPGGLSAACIDLLTRGDDRTVMGEGGRAYAESEFEINHIADQFEALLKAIGDRAATAPRSDVWPADPNSDTSPRRLRKA